ncbi:MAG: hypothetical protein ACTSRG_23850 [Candidatus Helarchaeota archaeon]
MAIELTLGLLRVRNFGPSYSPLMSIIQGLFEGGVTTSFIAYVTRSAMAKKYKTLIVITGVAISIGIVLLISIPLASGNSYTSYRAISHPISMISFSVWYILVIFLFWIFPLPQDKEASRLTLTTIRKAAILYYLIGIAYSTLWLLIWIPTGNRAIYFGFMGGPYITTDIFTTFLWFCFNNFVENISVFIGPWSIGVRIGLINVTETE